jgi:hypothetical protein
MTTFAPASTNRSAIAYPIPLLPPVTTAHCPPSAPGATWPLFGSMRLLDLNVMMNRPTR